MILKGCRWTNYHDGFIPLQLVFFSWTQLLILANLGPLVPQRPHRPSAFFFPRKKIFPPVKIFGFSPVKKIFFPWKSRGNFPWKINSPREIFGQIPPVKTWTWAWFFFLIPPVPRKCQKEKISQKFIEAMQKTYLSSILWRSLVEKSGLSNEKYTAVLKLVLYTINLQRLSTDFFNHDCKIADFSLTKITR